MSGIENAHGADDGAGEGAGAGSGAAAGVSAGAGDGTGAADPQTIRLGEHTVQLRPGGGKYPYGSPLVVTGTQRTAVIDSCLGTSPQDADLLLLSHYHEDHTVGLGEFRGEVWAHDAEVDALQSTDKFAAAMELEDDEVESVLSSFRWSPVTEARGFADGDVFDLGGGVTITALHLPGHTPGHSGFVIEPDGVAFLGDIDLSSFGPLYSDADAGVADYRTALNRCAHLDAKVYATAHHKGPYTDREEYLEALEAFAAVIDRREHDILDLVRTGRSKPEEMVGQGVIYRPGKRPGFADRVELSSCLKHLEDLVDREILLPPDADGRYSFA